MQFSVFLSPITIYGKRTVQDVRCWSCKYTQQVVTSCRLIAGEMPAT